MNLSNQVIVWRYMPICNMWAVTLVRHLSSRLVFPLYSACSTHQSNRFDPENRRSSATSRCWFTFVMTFACCTEIKDRKKTVDHALFCLPFTFLCSWPLSSSRGYRQHFGSALRWRFRDSLTIQSANRCTDFVNLLDGYSHRLESTRYALFNESCSVDSNAFSATKSHWAKLFTNTTLDALKTL